MRPELPGIGHEFVEANGMRFSVATAGSGDVWHSASMASRSAGTRGTTKCPFSLEIFRASAARPGALTAMLNYYRALGRGGCQRQLAQGSPPIEVPTLLFWGTEDAALGTELTHGMATYVPNLTIRYVPGVGHWSQQEAPDDLNPILAAWLADEEVPVLPGDEQYRETTQEQGIQA